MDSIDSIGFVEASVRPSALFAEMPRRVMVSVSPACPPEAADRASSTLYGHDVGHDERRHGQNGYRWRLRARLFGGIADGRAVQLDSLIP